MEQTVTKTIDMQEMRYLNLFERITRIRAKHCFIYHQALIFIVPKPFAARAIGEGGKNIKQIGMIFGKRIKVISPLSKGASKDEVAFFIRNIVAPASFSGIDMNDQEVIINAGARNKAMLIGRNRRRLEELRSIVKSYLQKDLRIV